MRASYAALLAMLAFPGLASAQEEAEGEALGLFEESVTAYQEGRFDDATELLTRAYTLHPEPVLLYNLGRAQDGAGDFADAIESYERYLDEIGDIPDRGAIEQRVATLRQNLEERARLGRLDDVSDSAPTEQEPEPASSDGPSAAPWIVAGVGVLGIGVGAILGGLALSAHDEALTAPSQEETASAQDRAEGLALGSTIAFIAGGVIAAVGVTWGVIDLMGSGGSGEEASARLEVGPGSVSVRGRF